MVNDIAKIAYMVSLEIKELSLASNLDIFSGTYTSSNYIKLCFYLPSVTFSGALKE